MSPASPNAPYIRRLYGSPTPQPNDDWLTAQSLNVHYLAATNDLPQAEARMQRGGDGPGNRGLQMTMPPFCRREDCHGQPNAS